MAFHFEKLTIKGQEAVANAQSLATNQGHAQVEPLHLLQALLEENEGVIAPLLEKIGANRRNWTASLKANCSGCPRSAGAHRHSRAANWSKCWMRPSARPTR